MKRALTLATGMAVGYVAGTRAGQERYVQIKQQAHKISQQPAVADIRATLKENAEAATKTVAGKVTGAASGLVHKLGAGESEEARFPADDMRR